MKHILCILWTAIPLCCKAFLPQHTIIQHSALYNTNDGSVGDGPNWIERSFPIGTDKAVDDYDVGICGDSYETGPLSARMHDAILAGSKFDTSQSDIRQALALYSMDCTAKEAVRAALKQNGLEMVEKNNEWATTDSIRLQDDDTLYDTWEDAVDHWTPGQSFSFVARQVPAQLLELSLTELLQALDPDGQLHQQAQDRGILLPLLEIQTDNAARREAVKRQAPTVTPDDARGYRPIAAHNIANSTMHVMDALVSHGCLIVDELDIDDTDAVTQVAQQVVQVAVAAAAAEHGVADTTSMDLMYLEPLSANRTLHMDCTLLSITTHCTVWDEAADQWYQPPGTVVLPGLLLQVATRNEIPAALYTSETDGWSVMNAIPDLDQIRAALVE